MSLSTFLVHITGIDGIVPLIIQSRGRIAILREFRTIDQTSC